jgi:hypothetical protein
MIAMLHFTTLAAATVFAAAAAVAFHWLLIHAVFLLMRPATARRISARSEVVRGTAALTQAFSTQR